MVSIYGQRGIREKRTREIDFYSSKKVIIIIIIMAIGNGNLLNIDETCVKHPFFDNMNDLGSMSKNANQTLLKNEKSSVNVGIVDAEDRSKLSALPLTKTNSSSTTVTIDSIPNDSNQRYRSENIPKIASTIQSKSRNAKSTGSLPARSRKYLTVNKHLFANDRDDCDLTQSQFNHKQAESNFSIVRNHSHQSENLVPHQPPLKPPLSRATISSKFNAEKLVNEIESSNNNPAHSNSEHHHYRPQRIDVSTTNSNHVNAYKQQPLLNLSGIVDNNSQQYFHPNHLANHNHHQQQRNTSPLRLTMPKNSSSTSKESSTKTKSISELFTHLFPIYNQSFGRNFRSERDGISELLASLALLCVLSLMMAFLALNFVQRSSYSMAHNVVIDHDPIISSPSSTNQRNNSSQNSHQYSSNKSNRQTNQNLNAYSNQLNRQDSSHHHHLFIQKEKDTLRVFQISMSLSVLTIALDLCCLFVCCLQFLSIIKLFKKPTPIGIKGLVVI
ncbi:chitinase [Sarcoptes scabiei]|nr:chitinase [Sarcoptes scabiei]